jgi:hypothetical protein
MEGFNIESNSVEISERSREVLSRQKERQREELANRVPKGDLAVEKFCRQVRDFAETLNIDASLLESAFGKRKDFNENSSSELENNSAVA